MSKMQGMPVMWVFAGLAEQWSDMLMRASVINESRYYEAGVFEQ
jgi:hypothetical protein